MEMQFYQEHDERDKQALSKNNMVNLLALSLPVLTRRSETCLSSQLTQCDSHLVLRDSQIRIFDVWEKKNVRICGERCHASPLACLLCMHVSVWACVRVRFAVSQRVLISFSLVINRMWLLQLSVFSHQSVVLFFFSFLKWRVQTWSPLKYFNIGVRASLCPCHLHKAILS